MMVLPRSVTFRNHGGLRRPAHFRLGQLYSGAGVDMVEHIAQTRIIVFRPVLAQDPGQPLEGRAGVIARQNGQLHVIQLIQQAAAAANRPPARPLRRPIAAGRIPGRSAPDGTKGMRSGRRDR